MIPHSRPYRDRPTRLHVTDRDLEAVMEQGSGMLVTLTPPSSLWDPLRPNLEVLLSGRWTRRARITNRKIFPNAEALAEDPEIRSLHPGMNPLQITGYYATKWRHADVEHGVTVLTVELLDQPATAQRHSA